MLYKGEKGFTKENLDNYLKELAKEFRKLNGKHMPAEIILVGGAAILTNYGFRNMTTDIDALIYASSAMTDAINRVRDKFDLPHGWLNSDFKFTSSYSPKLSQYSVYYRTFSNVLVVRTMLAEYLIAMKLRSARQYKNDLSDIVGILAEHEKEGKPIRLDDINLAVENLYGSWEHFLPQSKELIEDLLSERNYETKYTWVREKEKKSKEILIEFEQEYPNVTTESNVNTILKNLTERIEK